MNDAARDQVTGVVLAGGQSRRMGGVNKALQEHLGQPLFMYAVHNLQACCATVVINANRDQNVFRDAGFTVFGDGDYKNRGPVAGLHAALSHATTPYVAIAACDQLELPADVYQTLCCEADDAKGVYARNATDTVPTCAVLPVSLAAAARDALERKQLSLMSFMRLHARPVSFAQVEFANLNFQHQLAPE